MYLWCVLFVLWGTVHGQTSLVDYRLLEGNADRAARANGDACTTTGLFCSSCQQLSACVNGITVSVQDCGVGNVCSNRSCAPPSATHICNANTVTFVCTDIGMFPHPSDCKSFYVCNQVAGIPFALSCSAGWGYNPRTTYCDRKLTNDLCPTTPPVPFCQKVSETRALTTNPTIYYICLVTTGVPPVLYPSLFLCPNGKTYNNNFNCL